MAPISLSQNELYLRLTRRFRKQQEFAAGYSPLYSRLFGVLADWLAVGQGCDPLVDWLLQAAATRPSFDIPLLLLAGLHRDILTGVPEVQALARDYPTVGGTRLAQDPDLAKALRQAINRRLPSRQRTSFSRFSAGGIRPEGSSWNIRRTPSRSSGGRQVSIQSWSCSSPGP